ncbi:hypothetical protein LBMAG42_11370 [Deltaproteobacteria bacterium]|nr:hypothetical protein LBMAG42_11370 [Deltaproteobacteria bacterium]
MNPIRTSLLATLVLAGCPVVDAPAKDSDSGLGYHETGLVEDTADTADSTIEDTSDTGDSADTADTGEDTAVEEGLRALDAWPRAMVVNVGATYALRVAATQNSGDRDLYTGAGFAADDAAVATVDAGGVVTAVGIGTTTIRVTAEGLEADLTIEVREASEAEVTVTNETTGAPIEGASVLTSAGTVLTDAAGQARAPVLDGAPTTFTVWLDDAYYAVSVLDTVSRKLTIPLPVTADQSPTSQLHGAVDFSGIADAALGEEVFGLASGTVQGELPLFEVDDLLGPNRTLDYHGVAVDVPSNLFVEGYLADYYAGVWPGAVGVWGLGGPVPISELAAGLNGTGDAMALIIDHLADFSWSQSGGYTAVSGATTEAPIAPSVAFSDTAHIALPTLSVGFEGTEEQFVCTFDETADGWVLTGLGLDAGVVDVQRVPVGSVSAARGSAVYTLAQVGGLGSGGGVSVATAPDDGGTVLFPDLQDIPVVNLWDHSSRELDVTVDAAATLVRVSFIDTDGLHHQLVTDGSWTGIVDKQNPSFGRGKADVLVESYTVFEGNFEEWVSTGDWNPEHRSPTTVARDTLEH